MPLFLLKAAFINVLVFRNVYELTATVLTSNANKYKKHKKNNKKTKKINKSCKVELTSKVILMLNNKCKRYKAYKLTGMTYCGTLVPLFFIVLM